MMAPIVGFVLILCACMSISGVYSLENCPDAKYQIETQYITITCYSASDACGLPIISNKVKLDVHYVLDAPEDILEAYYNISIVGNNITAGSSGKAVVEVFPPDPEVKGLPKNSTGGIEVSTILEGNMPDGEKGVETIKLYFNEQMKDTPDICVTTEIFLEDVGPVVTHA